MDVIGYMIYMVGIEVIYLLDLWSPLYMGRLKWHPMSPTSLVLVAWVAYSDWVISPSPAAGILNAHFGFLDFLDIMFLMGPYLPLCCHHVMI